MSKPTQNRDAPAFQEYAAQLLAHRQYRRMTLAQRGLLHTLRLECWVNKSVPSSPCELAEMLRMPTEEIAELLPAVMPFFSVAGDDLTCPELDDYRTHLKSIRAKQAEGGKRAMEKRYCAAKADE